MNRQRKWASILVLLCFALMTLQMSAYNILSIPDVIIGQGGNIALPVNLENDDAVVALQFTLTVPNGFTINTSTSQLTERKADHTYRIRQMGGNEYLCMVYSPSNTALKGNRGTVFYIAMSAPSQVEVGSVYSLTMSNAVASDVATDDVLTEATTGEITIAEGVDLIPRDVTSSISSLNPGDHLLISWSVANTGMVPTTGGWSETIALVDENGKMCSLGTNYYNDLLAAQGTVNRQMEVIVPRVPGLHGNVKPMVRINPNSDCGERPEVRANNSMNGSFVYLNALLYLDLYRTKVAEATTRSLNAVVTRSGSREDDLTVSISSDDSRISHPGSVTIKSGQSSVNVPISLTDNSVVDDNEQVIFTASAIGYADTLAYLIIEDNEYPQLVLQASKREMTEGDTVELTISIPKVRPVPLEVSITCNASRRFVSVPKVVIDAGSTSATALIVSLDDKNPDLDKEVTFIASSYKYNNDEAWVTLHDNDMPTLDLMFTPTTVNEASGPNAIIAKLRRLDHTDSYITVRFSDDSQGDLSYPQSLYMGENVNEVQFSIGAKDNLIVDGERIVNVTAAVYVKSCYCQASSSSAGSVTRQVTVTDNDGPTVTVSSSRSTIAEGTESMLTVGRNADLNHDLTVILSSDNDLGLEYEHEVTIPAGQWSVKIPLKALANTTTDDDHVVALTANSDGYASTSCWVMISNQTLPDAVITGISLSSSEVEVGQEVEISVTVANTGSYELPSQTKVTAYLDDNTQLANLYSQVALAPGDSTVIIKTIAMPYKVGSFQCYAIINEGRKVKETVTVNNTSDMVPIRLLSPFTSISLTTDKTVYETEESVRFSGTVSGHIAEGVPIEVYYICDGLRRTVETTIDANGNFSVNLQPLAGDMGHFIAGACYPSEKSIEELTEFDIVGLRRTSTKNITCDVLIFLPYETSIQIVNPSTVTLHNVKVNILSKPDNYDLSFSTISEMEGGTTSDIEMTIEGKVLSPQRAWEKAQLEIISDEGARTTVTIYLYCRSSRARLAADISSINTTMIKGQTRNYMFHITNIGQGNTGKITLSLPNWMNAVTPVEMPGLEQGDSALVVLSFTPTEDMQLNVPRTGRIGINCKDPGSTGLSLYYNIEPVSESTGTLIVDVCDEYTYNTSEAPHVQGAHVVVKHPTTNKVVAEGYTGDNGHFSVTLPEGYYALRVSADQHESYANYIVVDPGKNNYKTINLSFQAITTDWTVQETEVEDNYEIVTSYTYVTNVPRPVVTISGPTRVNGDEMAVGESQLLYFTITNVGLIETRDIVFELPESNGEWSMTALAYTEPFTLAANESVVVPVVLKRLSDEPTVPANYYSYWSSQFKNCIVILYTRYVWACGEDIKEADSSYKFPIEICSEPEIVESNSSSQSNEPRDPTGSGGGYYNENENNGSIHPLVDDLCNPLHSKCLKSIAETAISAIPVIGQIYSVCKLVDDIVNREPDPMDLASVVVDIGSKLSDIGSKRSLVGGFCNFCSGLFSFIGIAKTFLDCVKEYNEIYNEDGKIAMMSTGESWLDDFCMNSEYSVEQFNNVKAILNEITGDSIWFNSDDETIQPFWVQASKTSKSDFTFDNLLPFKPESVSEQQLAMLIERFNNSYAGSNAMNRINADSLQYHCDEYVRFDQIAKDKGYETMSDMFNASYQVAKDMLSKEKSSVCSSVTMQLSQHLVMSRQAFRGTLTVYNGHNSVPIRDAKLTLVVTDEDDNLATAHEFEMTPETLNGFHGQLDLSSGWTLAAQETGIATILFIPTKYAAPAEEKVYSFGGSLSYVDPFSGLVVTRELYPEKLTVRPSPILSLDYFMQRDIYGDDPFTEVIEPMQPAEFALIIDNQGYGDANNVMITTIQPKIVDNEKGLLIDFRLVGSQLNGDDAILAMDSEIATDFGTIKANSQAYAQWWLKSSLLGHFTTYDVSYNHLTSYGNEDLSLLDTVKVHELIHGFTTDDMMCNSMRGFIVNDMPDANDSPDKIYFSNATQEGVSLSNASISRIGEREYKLEITSSAPGWNYGSVMDPTVGRQKLIRIVRQSDGQDIYKDNVWATDRTLIDGVDWLYENRLHYIVNMSGLNETYILTLYTKSGDVDGDGKTNISDVITVIDYLLKEDVDVFYFDNADLTCDGEIGVDDLTSLIDLILEK